MLFLSSRRYAANFPPNLFEKDRVAAFFPPHVAFDLRKTGGDLWVVVSARGRGPKTFHNRIHTWVIPKNLCLGECFVYGSLYRGSPPIWEQQFRQTPTPRTYFTHQVLQATEHPYLPSQEGTPGILKLRKQSTTHQENSAKPFCCWSSII